jgi:hypothetical protein
MITNDRQPDIRPCEVRPGAREALTKALMESLRHTRKIPPKIGSQQGFKREPKVSQCPHRRRVNSFSYLQ